MGTSSLAKLAGSALSRLDASSIVVFSVACVVSIFVVIAFIVWRIRRNSLKSVTLVGYPVRLSGASQVTIDQNKIPPTLNGQEYTYSFWLYLADYNTVTTPPKILFGRGSEESGKDGGGKGRSPLVYMDSTTNKMYLSVLLSGGAGQSVALAGVPSSQYYVTATVDYVPLQRWVHVALVVQDNLISVYVDGDLYTVKNASDQNPSSSGASPLPAIFGPTAGGVTVGSSVGGVNPNAFMSQLQVFNYGMTQRDIKLRYAGGPSTPSALGALGIPGYGIRSPVYRVDT